MLLRGRRGKLTASPTDVPARLASAAFGRIWRHRRQVVTLRFQVFLDFLDRAVELLVFAMEFLCRIVINYDVRIDAVAFDYPAAPILRIRRELRTVDRPTIYER